jgi:lysophospholipase L1-like esterase
MAKALPAFPTSIQLKYQKLLRAAARAMPAPVMASPPTHTLGAANANSTLDTARTTSYQGGQIEIGTDPRIEHIGRWAFNGASAYTGQIQNAANNAATKRGMHGQGIRFGFNGQVFDISLNTGSSSFIMYVTDMADGVRRRAQANDYTTADSSYHYAKFDFGSAGNRIIELYFSPSTLLRCLNIAPTGIAPADAACQVYRAPATDAPRILTMGDSYEDGTGSGNTNNCKLTVTDFMGERLGAPNLLSLGRGGTGFLNPNTASPAFGTYRQRITDAGGTGTGDLDLVHVGELDFVFLPGSVNDNLAINAAYTDAAVQAEIATLLPLVMAKQPRAVIYCWGPQVTNTAAGAAVQTRYDAMKAAVLAVAGGPNNPRLRWLDNSPSGENWMYGSASVGVNSRIIGADNVHLNDAGMALIGHRRASSILADARAVLAAAGL